jgi:hypothetical protein
MKKKWMEYLLIAGLTAGSASAAIWPFGSKDKTADEPQQEMQRPRRPQGGGDRQRPQMTPEQAKKMQQMRLFHHEVMKLGEAARNEADPVKKEELVGQLRTKLNVAADKMQAMHEKRLEQAGEEIDRLRERAEEMKKNRDQRIEEQIQKILAGEPPMGPPDGERGKRPDRVKDRKGGRPSQE